MTRIRRRDGQGRKNRLQRKSWLQLSTSPIIIARLVGTLLDLLRKGFILPFQGNRLLANVLATSGGHRLTLSLGSPSMNPRRNRTRNGGVAPRAGPGQRPGLSRRR